MRILIETVPHNEQRYDTVGDWSIEPDGTWLILVSELPTKQSHFPEKFAFLVALHELIEMAMCVAQGITPKMVDGFDLTWKAHHGIVEPGDDPNAPYYHDHQLATGFERQMAALLGVNWIEYERAINALSPPEGEDDGDKQD